MKTFEIARIIPNGEIVVSYLRGDNFYFVLPENNVAIVREETFGKDGELIALVPATGLHYIRELIEEEEKE